MRTLGYENLALENIIMIKDKQKVTYILFFLFIALAAPLRAAEEADEKWFAMAETGNAKQLEELYSSDKINVNAINSDGDRALHLSASKGHLGCVKYIIKQGTDINAKNEEGETALHKSAYNGHADCVAYLVEAGADINATDSYSDTALHLSAREGHFDCVKCLIRAGIDFTLKGKNNDNPQTQAKKRKHTEIAKFLDDPTEVVNEAKTSAAKMHKEREEKLIAQYEEKIHALQKKHEELEKNLRLELKEKELTLKELMKGLNKK